MANSLYDRLGGETAVQAAVELFYEKVLSDGRINHFFDAIPYISGKCTTAHRI